MEEEFVDITTQGLAGRFTLGELAQPNLIELDSIIIEVKDKLHRETMQFLFLVERSRTRFVVDQKKQLQESIKFNTSYLQFLLERRKMMV